MQGDHVRMIGVSTMLDTNGTGTSILRVFVSSCLRANEIPAPQQPLRLCVEKTLDLGMPILNGPRLPLGEELAEVRCLACARGLVLCDDNIIERRARVVI